MSSEGNNYPFDHLPTIDYDAHPAYGRVMSMPMLGARLKAITIFGYGFFLTAAQRMIDVAHLPRPDFRGNSFVAILRSLPTYLRLVMLQRLGRFSAGSAYAPKTERGSAVFARLDRDGFAAVRLGANKVTELRHQLGDSLTTLERGAAIPADPESSRLVMNPDAAPELFRSFNQMAADAGLIEAASAYLKRPVGIGQITIEVVEAPTGAVVSPFADVSVDASPCDGFKIDTDYNVLKMVVYLGDVGPSNGALSYVAGSNRAGRRFWDAMIRRANDLAGLSSTLPASRETFYALSAGLQRKASFGADLVADSNFTAAIQSGQITVSSGDGDAVIYDPAGIHRDGMPTSGRRSAVLVTFAELPR